MLFISPTSEVWDDKESIHLKSEIVVWGKDFTNTGENKIFLYLNKI
jgi:hypothetical protein